MTKTEKTKLIKAYKAYKAKKTKKTTVLSFFRAFIPEIIFRTTKLEGEKVTRKIVTRIAK